MSPLDTDITKAAIGLTSVLKKLNANPAFAEQVMWAIEDLIKAHMKKATLTQEEGSGE